MLKRGRVPAAKDGGEGQREEALPENGAQILVSHWVEKVKQTHPWKSEQAHMCEKKLQMGKLGQGSHVSGVLGEEQERRLYQERLGWTVKGSTTK